MQLKLKKKAAPAAAAPAAAPAGEQLGFRDASSSIGWMTIELRGDRSTWWSCHQTEEIGANLGEVIAITVGGTW